MVKHKRSMLLLLAVIAAVPLVLFWDRTTEPFPCPLDTRQPDQWSACMTSEFVGREKKELDDLLVRNGFSLMESVHPHVFHYIKYAGGMSSGAISIFVQSDTDDRFVVRVDLMHR